MRPLLAACVLAIAACSPESDVSLELGARCDDKSDCFDKCLPDGPDFPGGFCTTTCLSDGDCPSGAHCVEDEGGVCLFACELEADCDFLGQGWQCTPEDGLPDDTEVTVCNGD